MTLFRPCIDIHKGSVKQIVGATLKGDETDLKTNFVAKEGAAWFAKLYKEDNLNGGHLIKLGEGNDEAAESALGAWPNGLDNAEDWLKKGAQKVIVTSWLFVNGVLDMDRVRSMSDCVGPLNLVIDLSCRRTQDGWCVATNRWQTVTSTKVDADTLEKLSKYCCEFLVHATDQEGRCEGIDEDLVAMLGKSSPVPCTYAGGANSIKDLDTVNLKSKGRVDLTVGSALDIFGGSLVKYEECVKWNREHADQS